MNIQNSINSVLGSVAVLRTLQEKANMAKEEEAKKAKAEAEKAKKESDEAKTQRDIAESSRLDALGKLKRVAPLYEVGNVKNPTPEYSDIMDDTFRTVSGQAETYMRSNDYRESLLQPKESYNIKNKEEDE